MTHHGNHYDVIVVGGGVAGMSAALWADELGLRAVVLESAPELGGQLLWTYNAIKNHLGVEARTGRELQRVFLDQMRNRRFELKNDCAVVGIHPEKREVTLSTGDILSAEALVIATGIRRRKLNLEHEDAFLGRGIIVSGKRDIDLVAGKHLYVVGGGDAALENALILSEFAESVTLVHRRDTFRARPEFVESVLKNRKIQVLAKTIVTRLFGRESLEAIELTHTETGRTSVVPTDFLIHRLGVEPNTELLRGKLSLDSNGYCNIDARCETSHQHVFAIGDVANPLAPTISGAIGMGATALKTVYETLRHRPGAQHF